MHFHLKEYDKYIEVTGYKNISFLQAETFLKEERKKHNQNVEIQFFDADLVATEKHLYFAAINALEAFKNKINLSKSLAMETMLYASAQRQIQKAIFQSGIKPETTKMAAIIISQDVTGLRTVLDAINVVLGINPDESVLEMTSQKVKRLKEAFQISEKELEVTVKAKDRDCEMTMVDLIIEHMALLATML